MTDRMRPMRKEENSVKIKKKKQRKKKENIK